MQTCEDEVVGVGDRVRSWLGGRWAERYQRSRWQRLDDWLLGGFGGSVGRHPRLWAAAVVVPVVALLWWGMSGSPAVRIVRALVLIAVAGAGLLLVVRVAKARDQVPWWLKPIDVTVIALAALVVSGKPRDGAGWIIGVIVLLNGRDAVRDRRRQHRKVQRSSFDA